MPRFLPKPSYTQGEIAQILNAYEADLAQRGECRCSGKIRTGVTCPGCGRYRRKVWNRKNTRTWLQAHEVNGHQRAPGCKRFYAFEELKSMAPDVVDSMLNLDAYEDAQAA